MSALSISSISKHQDRLSITNCFPELALLDVVLHVLHAHIAKLAIAQARHRVVFVKTLLRLGRGLHGQVISGAPSSIGHFIGELPRVFAGAGLALDQEWALQRDRRVDRDAQIVGRNIAVCVP